MNIIEKIKKGLSRFWNETLGPDYSTAELAELRIDSTNPTEAALARSLQDIEKRDNRNAGKGGGRIQDQMKVSPDKLIKTPKTQSKGNNTRAKSADKGERVE